MIHRNVRAVLAGIMDILAREGINVENMTNKSRGEWAYTMVDLNTVIGDDIRAQLNAMEPIIRVRIV
jgi:D-3-phosphoglycerate dehydrogenase